MIARRRQDVEHDHAMTRVWLTANLQRAAKMPPLEKFLVRKRPVVRQGAEHHTTMLSMLGLRGYRTARGEQLPVMPPPPPPTKRKEIRRGR